ncbi:ATPase [Clostridia bacterium]|nr:ATPase [Clostridia bacterium]
MIKSDLIEQLFTDVMKNNRDGIIKTANEIIEDERKKNHATMANRLQNIINQGFIIPKNSVSALSLNDCNEQESKFFEIMFPEKELSDVVLTNENKQQIQQIIHEFINWDVLLSNGAYPMRRILFYGCPGCGKTLTAHAIASEIGLPLLYVRFDGVISSYLGETASNIRKVFDFAKNDNYVILFDEFDAIGRSRNDQHEHGEIKRVVNAFLQQVDSFKGRSLIIAATNFEESLDYAVWRRFDSTLRFDMPDNDDRVRLFNIRLNQFDGSQNIIKEFAKHMENFTHSDTEQAAVSVLKRCILDGRRMYTKSDVETAVLQQERLVNLRKTQY